MASDKILVVKNLIKTFGSHAGVDGIDIAISPGEIVGLLGPNGSGKSTTLHCITGFYTESSGSISIAGHEHRSPAAKDSFGFFPDDLPAPDSLDAIELIAFHARLRPRMDRDLAYQLLNVLGLDGHLTKMLGDYSHGMRRKLQLVLALAHRPELLILDEPLRGLDPEAAVIMQAVIDEFARGGGAVLVATHDLLAAESGFQNVIVLARGKVVAEGHPSSIIRREKAADLTDAFVSLTGLKDRVEQAQAEVSRIMGEALYETDGSRL